MDDEVVQIIPNFISTFETSKPFFYFLHIVNPEEATLTVEVIGPNLTFTFHHSRAVEQRISTSQILSLLDRKTCGFSTLIKGRDERHVLAWSESGHGFGRNGDLLDAQVGSPVLGNRAWTLRVIRLGKILGQPMGSPRDRIGGYADPQARKGIFAGCHVELKLATHAVHTLLQRFNITTASQRITRDDLKKLRHVQWEDGTRPRFEIYFSRKECGLCGSFVRALELLTGVSIKLCWRERLTHKVYTTHASKSDAAAARRVAIPVADDIHVIGRGEDAIMIEDDESDDDETVCGDDLIEIASDGGDGMDKIIDLDTPPSTPSFGRQADPLVDVDEFIREMTTYSDKVNASPDSAQVASDMQRREAFLTQTPPMPPKSPGLGFLSP